MLSDKEGVVVTTKDVTLTTGLDVSAGETGRLVARADDGRPIVQFPHHKRPWVLEPDEVRLRWPFAGLAVAAHYIPEQARLYVVDNDRGVIHGNHTALRRGQALLVLAGELARDLWEVDFCSREDLPDMLAVRLRSTMGEYDRFVARLTAFRAEHGLEVAPPNHEWLP